MEGRVVRHFVKEDYNEVKEEDYYFLCLNPECEMTYFSQKESEPYLISDLSIPIGFKKGAYPKYVCYCNKVTEEEIVEALDSGYTFFKDIVKRTGAMKNPNCKVNNPLGECCSLEIKKLIKETLEKKNL